MKHQICHKIIPIALLSSLVIIISLLCLTITKFMIFPNRLSKSPTHYTKKLRLPVLVEQ